MNGKSLVEAFIDEQVPYLARARWTMPLLKKLWGMCNALLVASLVGVIERHQGVTRNVLFDELFQFLRAKFR